MNKQEQSAFDAMKKTLLKIEWVGDKCPSCPKCGGVRPGSHAARLVAHTEIGHSKRCSLYTALSLADNAMKARE